DNYLIDLKASIIMDVEPTRAIRQAEVGATKTMIDRTEERFGLKPQRLSGDSAYGTAEILNWIVNEKNIAPHVALFDKSERDDGTFGLSAFRFDANTNSYTCPAGKLLVQYRRHFTNQRTGIVFGNRRQYRAERRDCAACPLKAKCCPGPNPRKLSVSVHEAARDIVRNLRDTPEYLQSRRERKKVEMLFAHLKRILRMGRLRLRGPCGARDEFTLAAVAQNLRKLAKLIPMPQPAMAV
ncbi:MAG: transposase, partial [Alphaproteobacteria bacterium]|nr:transposase [Alphaproteobacteria bacterium]